MSTSLQRAIEDDRPRRRAAPGGYLDLWAALAALPLFVVAGWPLMGWVVGAGVWAGQRLLELVIQRRASASDEPRRVVGLMIGGILARAWIVGLAVLIVGLQDRRTGLAVALMIVALFTISFVQKLAVGVAEAGTGRHGGLDAR